jgi:hypothetical protein
MHSKSPNAKVQERENSRATNWRWSFLGAVQKSARPLLNESGKQGASDAQSETQKPECVANKRRGHGLESDTSQRWKRYVARIGVKLLRDSGEDLNHDHV